MTISEKPVTKKQAEFIFEVLYKMYKNGNLNLGVGWVKPPTNNISTQK